MSKRPREELKFKDTSNSSVLVDTDWDTFGGSTESSISGVQGGDTGSDRNGRTYLIHSVQVNGLFQAAPSESQGGPIQPDVVRVMVVLDKQTNGALLTGDDVMDACLVNTEGFRNLTNEERFDILYDEEISFSFGNLNEGAVNMFAIEGMFKTYSMAMEFENPIRVVTTGLTNLITEVVDNSLHILAVRGQGSTPTITHCFQARIRFTG